MSVTKNKEIMDELSLYEFGTTNLSSSVRGKARKLARERNIPSKEALNIILQSEPLKMNKNRTNKEVHQDYMKVLKNSKVFYAKAIKYSVARDLIEISVFWYSHSSGRKVPIPKFAKRVAYDEDFGMHIKFGSNYFLINKAVKGIARSLLKYGDTGYISSYAYSDARYYLTKCVFSSYRCSHYPIKDDGHMVFGVHSIDTKKFISRVYGLVFNRNVSAGYGEPSQTSRA